jgi:hypothetical protein
MFPSVDAPSEPPRRTLRAALRHAAELTVAFATLESYTLADLRRRPSELKVEAAATPSTVAGLKPGPSAAGPSSGPATHPHRRAPLADRTLPRRPGTITPREQLCHTPLPRTRPLAANPPNPAPQRAAVPRS